VSPVISDRDERQELKGRVYAFAARFALCPNCGSDIDVPEVEDGNLAALYAVYRAENGIISLEDVRAIPSKYGIGNEPLSCVLGWGKNTFSRYYDGDVPSRQYSDTLKRILSDTDYFHSLLLGGKTRISDAAYNKSMEAIDRLTNRGVSTGITAVAGRVLSFGYGFTNMKLQKALYYAQAFFMAFYGKPLFDDDCEAWTHGPVYRTVYQRFAHNGNVIDNKIPYSVGMMPERAERLVEAVAFSAGKYEAWVLRDFTHSELPWIKARGNLPEGASSNRVITKSEIRAYFTRIRNDAHINTVADIDRYFADMASKVARFR
jgi:uncharacterized phage-associated protein